MITCTIVSLQPHTKQIIMVLFVWSKAATLPVYSQKEDWRSSFTESGGPSATMASGKQRLMLLVDNWGSEKHQVTGTTSGMHIIRTLTDSHTYLLFTSIYIYIILGLVQDHFLSQYGWMTLIAIHSTRGSLTAPTMDLVFTTVGTIRTL